MFHLMLATMKLMIHKNQYWLTDRIWIEVMDYAGKKCEKIYPDQPGHSHLCHT